MPHKDCMQSNRDRKKVQRNCDCDRGIYSQKHIRLLEQRLSKQIIDSTFNSTLDNRKNNRSNNK